MYQNQAAATPAQVRAAIARGEITTPTASLCPGYAQANLVILPREWAFDFLLFALRNRQACPLLEVLEPGDPFLRVLAPGADVRDTLPRYRVWRQGRLEEEPTDIHQYWRQDLVSFFLGCSFGFDEALSQAGLPVRHRDLGRNVPMYRTGLPAASAGRLSGPLVVSMRPMPAHQVDKARQVSERYGESHGGPVHAGDPALIGVRDLDRPHYGEAVPVEKGETPVFWACGVTPQAALEQSEVEFAITHAPGHMFISDLRADQLSGKTLL
ncbi:MAG: putative hydro-lyase [Thermodesulfobacteriota bacterium]